MRLIALVFLLLSIPAWGEEKLYNFNGITASQGSTMLKWLIKGPWEEVNDTVVKLNNQIVEQNKPTPTSTPIPAPVPTPIPVPTSTPIPTPTPKDSQ